MLKDIAAEISRVHITQCPKDSKITWAAERQMPQTSDAPKLASMIGLELRIGSVAEAI